MVEEKISPTRIQRRTKTITISTPQILDRGIVITRSMMICPPLMVLGAIGFSSISNGDSILAAVGAIAGLLLGVLVITNKGSWLMPVRMDEENLSVNDMLDIDF